MVYLKEQVQRLLLILDHMEGEPFHRHPSSRLLHHCQASRPRLGPSHRRQQIHERLIVDLQIGQLDAERVIPPILHLTEHLGWRQMVANEGEAVQEPANESTAAAATLLCVHHGEMMSQFICGEASTGCDWGGNTCCMALGIRPLCL